MCNKPIEIKYMSGFAFALLASNETIRQTVKNEDKDETAFINPNHIIAVTFDSVNLDDVHEDYFVIKMLGDKAYHVRQKYWEGFKKDWCENL